MSTVPTAAQQAAAKKFVADFQAALLPARLASEGEKGYTNGIILKSEISKRGLAYTVENLVRVVNEILFSDVLIWAVEPAKLQAERRAKLKAPLTEKTAWQETLQSETARATNQKAQDVAAAKKKRDDESIRQSKELIEKYNPITSRGRYDGLERETMQKFWTAELQKEIASGGNLQTFATALAAAIQKRYNGREKASERL
jgi:hypothetical protein